VYITFRSRHDLMNKVLKLSYEVLICELFCVMHETER
jgi:hypothetical protein